VLALLGVLVLGECAARVLHDSEDVDFLFDWYFLDQQLLRSSLGPSRDSPAMRVNSLGFRGTWEPAPRGTAPRVLVTGAGESFADNIQEGATWTDRLASLLTAPQDSGVELWNLSMHNSTVRFVEVGLLPRILEASPDVLVLSHGGFNEALRGDIPERLVIRPEAWFFNAVFGFQLARSLWLGSASALRSVRGGERRHKVSVAELEASYDLILTRARSAGIQVVLLKQVIIHPDIDDLWRVADMEAYRDAISRVAGRHGVPVVDPREFMRDPLEQFFDERQELYNSRTHRLIAEALAPVVGELLGD